MVARSPMARSGLLTSSISTGLSFTLASLVPAGSVRCHARPEPCCRAAPRLGSASMIACLDLEGVLVPEIWINVAERTGIAALRRTTRDEPDYDKLMRGRIEILDQHGLGLPDIQAVIDSMQPLGGAVDFLEWLRSRVQVIILSDTFAEFAAPLMRKLGWPTLFCNALDVDGSGRVAGYR